MARTTKRSKPLKGKASGAKKGRQRTKACEAAPKTGRASLFYAMVVPPECDVATQESLTSQGDPDLVRAHLGTNYSYFGAIDKTLSGFYVLSDEGDDYHLCDLRDPMGQIWFQGHDTRELRVIYDNVADYVRCKEELAKAQLPEQQNAIRARHGAKPREPSVAVPTAELAARYQWLVWLLAQPLQRRGKVMQLDDELVRNATTHFMGYWASLANVTKAFAAERPLLRRDAHLAVYWLLHAASVADDELLLEVKSAAKGLKAELWLQFAAKLGRLRRTATLAVLPSFRSRRSLFIGYVARHTRDVVGWLRRAVEIEPASAGMMKAVALAASAGVPDVSAIEAMLKRIRAGVPAVRFLRGWVDLKKGNVESEHADAVARAAVGATDVEWEASFYYYALALEQLAKFLRDPTSLNGAADRLLARDPYPARHLQLGIAAAKARGDAAAQAHLEARLTALAPLRETVLALVGQDEKSREAAIAALPDFPDGQKYLLARRILYRANEFTQPSVEFALRHLVEGFTPADTELLHRGLLALRRSAKEFLVDMTDRIIGANHPLVAVLEGLLVVPDGSDAEGSVDIVHEMQLETMREGASLALERLRARWAGDQGGTSEESSGVPNEATPELHAMLERAAAARASGKPLLAVTDTELGWLVGKDVGERAFQDSVSGEVWFLDTEGRFHYFDGYEVTSPPFEVRDLTRRQDATAEVLAPVDSVTSRLMEWSDDGRFYCEYVQYRDRLVSYRGTNKGRDPRSFALVFPSEDRATEAVGRLRSNLPLGWTETSPFYLPKRGGVQRTYYAPLPGGGESDKRETSCVLGNVWTTDEERIYATAVEAAAVHDAWELAFFQAKNGRVVEIEWKDRLRPLEDMPLIEWLKKRSRDDRKDVVWHVRALADFRTYFEKHRLSGLSPSLRIEVGSGAPEEEVARYESATPGLRVPDVLRTFWRKVGGAMWSYGEAGERILRPLEVLQRRAAARAQGRDVIEKMSPVEREAYGGVFRNLDPLVVDRSGGLLTFFDTRGGSEEDRIFAQYPYPMAVSELRFEKALAQTLSTRFIADFILVVAQAMPPIHFLRYGMTYSPKTARKRFEASDSKQASFVELFFDADNCILGKWEGREGADSTWSARKFDAETEVREAFQRAVDEALANKMMPSRA